MSSGLTDYERQLLQTIESIATTLPDVPGDTVESQLVTFDMLIGVVGEYCRQPAAKLLRETVARCASEFHRERIARAADEVAAGRPCAFTPEGLTAQQAAQVATITLSSTQIDELRMQTARARLEEVETELDALDAHDPVAYGERAEKLWPLFDERDVLRRELNPPKLPELSIAEFFPHLTVRVVQDFVDFDGDKVNAGEVLHFKERSYFPYDGGYTLTFREKVIRLAEIDAANEPMIENSGNAYFAPIADIPALRECVLAVDEYLRAFAPETSPLVRSNVERCRAWLDADGRGPAPLCLHQDPFAERGPTRGLNILLAFLFAGVRLAQSPEG